MVLAQLVEQSHPTPEICGSNPDIGKILSSNCIIEKMKIKEKEAANGPSLKKLKVVNDGMPALSSTIKIWGKNIWLFSLPSFILAWIISSFDFGEIFFSYSLLHTHSLSLSPLTFLSGWTANKMRKSRDSEKFFKKWYVPIFLFLGLKLENALATIALVEPSVIKAAFYLISYFCKDVIWQLQ